MGLFSSKKRGADAAQWAARAQTQEEQAREAGSRAAAHRQRLESGTSTDRGFDRYKAREAEEDQRLATANARDFRNMAQQLRKGWF